MAKKVNHTQRSDWMHGTVKRIVADRGFGFIRENQSGKEYFFHRSGMLEGSVAFEQLQVGDEVTFDPQDSDKGLRATHVRG